VGSEKGIDFTFKREEYIIKDVNQRLITVTIKLGNLYQVTLAKLKNHVYAVTEKQSENDHFSKEDLICGIADVVIQKLARDDLVEEFDYSVSKKISFCEPCLKETPMMI